VISRFGSSSLIDAPTDRANISVIVMSKVFDDRPHTKLSKPPCRSLSMSPTFPTRTQPVIDNGMTHIPRPELVIAQRRGLSQALHFSELNIGGKMNCSIVRTTSLQTCKHPSQPAIIKHNADLNLCSPRYPPNRVLSGVIRDVSGRGSALWGPGRAGR
jgi:hypothetical protein